MELLEGVMAFAVVMIILSTIATGVTEGLRTVKLATSQDQTRGPLNDIAV